MEAIKRGTAKPIASMTQLGTIRLGERTGNRVRLVKDFVPLTSLENLGFAGWDINKENIYEICLRNGVLERSLIKSLRDVLEPFEVTPGVFDPEYVRNLTGNQVKHGKSKMDLANQVAEDIKDFIRANSTESNGMVWCGSTEIFIQASDVHSTLEKFEAGLENSDSAIAPSMIYILAVPIVLYLVLFLDLARRAGMRGIQEWLSFYFQSPMTLPSLYPEHNLFVQWRS